MSLLTQFREKLAENGKELTLAEAEVVLEVTKKMVKIVKKTSQRELWKEIECLSRRGFWPDGQPLKDGEIEELMELMEHAKEL